MAIVLPPPPNATRDLNDFQWRDWFRKVQQFLTSIAAFSWNVIDFTDSNITDISSRRHQDLQSLQGGQSNEYYHLTATEYASLGSSTTVTTSAVNVNLTDTSHVIYITASGKTVTLPACTSGRIGEAWTIIQAVNGYVDITRTGSDTFIIPTSDTTIRLTTKGASVTLMCLTTSTWGIQ